MRFGEIFINEVTRCPWINMTVVVPDLPDNFRITGNSRHELEQVQKLHALTIVDHRWGRTRQEALCWPAWPQYRHRHYLRWWSLSSGFRWVCPICMGFCPSVLKEVAWSGTSMLVGLRILIRVSMPISSLKNRSKVLPSSWQASSAWSSRYNPLYSILRIVS